MVQTNSAEAHMKGCGTGQNIHFGSPYGALDEVKQLAKTAIWVGEHQFGRTRSRADRQTYVRFLGKLHKVQSAFLCKIFFLIT